MKNLVIDFGNTRQKLSVFSDHHHVSTDSYSNIVLEDIQKFIQEKGAFDASILSSVIPYPEEIGEFLRKQLSFIELTHLTKLPVSLDYNTPETLGKDRIALACAGNRMYPGDNVLIIDAGTAITYDLVTSDAAYLGGAISPGLKTRFRALHTFTGKLPLVELRDYDSLIGKNTEESILSGVVNGVVVELDGIISKYFQRFDNLKVLLTGGDHKYLAGKLKSGIFALPNLVLVGLNEILHWNAHN